MKSIELTFAIHYLSFGNEVDSRDIQVSIFLNRRVVLMQIYHECLLVSVQKCFMRGIHGAVRYCSSSTVGWARYTCNLQWRIKA